MMKTYEVVGHRILVRPFVVEDTIKTTSGVVLHKPQQTVQDEKGAVDRGVVVALGPDAYKGFDSQWCEVGDTVLWYRYAGRPIKGLYDQEADLHVLNDEDVLLKIVED